MAATPHLIGSTRHDCAPWDGPAFLMLLPLPPGTAPGGSNLRFSLWQPADIRSPRSFHFPRDSRLGTAMLEPGGADPQILGGTLRIDRAVEGAPVRGGFDLTAPGGRRYRGSFSAPWQPRQYPCR